MLFVKTNYHNVVKYNKCFRLLSELSFLVFNKDIDDWRWIPSFRLLSELSFLVFVKTNYHNEVKYNKCFRLLSELSFLVCT